MKLTVDTFVHTLFFNVSIAPPSFTAHPVSQVTVAGGDVILTCGTAGLPPPVIDWIKDGQVIRRGELSTSSLTISEVGRSDGGTYHCQATNKYDTAVSEVATLSINCKL